MKIPVISTFKEWGFNPLQIGSTLQNHHHAGRYRVCSLLVSIPYKSGQHFKSNSLYLQRNSYIIVSIPYKSGQHFKKGWPPVSRRQSVRVSIPYKSGQHFKVGPVVALSIVSRSVSIPYKSGQHFKKGRPPVDYPARSQVSIPYKSGQHFKSVCNSPRIGRGGAKFQSPTNRVNTSKPIPYFSLSCKRLQEHFS